MSSKPLSHTKFHTCLSGNSIWDVKTTLDMDQHASNAHLKGTVQEKL